MATMQTNGALLTWFMVLGLLFSADAPAATEAEAAAAARAALAIIDDDAEQDSDSDGLPDYLEDSYGSNPHDADSDDDSLPDGFEIDNGLNPLSADSDGDGLSDSYELDNGLDPANRDMDFDGIVDGLDVLCRFDPLNDDDGDGLCYGEDNCPSTANPDQQDADGDLIGDACDPLVNSTLGDRDGDSLADNADNCIDWPNPQQQDTDGDGIGDACQCGDINGDGQLSAQDWRTIRKARKVHAASFTWYDLELGELQRCDVSGDGVCNAEDANILASELRRGRNKVRGNGNQAVTVVLPRAVCPTLAQVRSRALGRLGYGASWWAAERIDFLQMTADDGQSNGYAGLDAYIHEQLLPWLVSDTEYFEQELAYSVEAAAYGKTAQFPTLGHSLDYLRSYYCDGGGGCDNPGEHRNRVIGNASEVKFLRASRSNKQLDAVLRDFWFNHFNISGRNNVGIWGLQGHEQALAENMYGPFEQLVQAQAKTAAMLDYLDLERNVLGARNENFARELMELHTVGVSRDVDGDGVIAPEEQTYDASADQSAANIVAVSRILTGYGFNNQTSVSNPSYGNYGAFEFTSTHHDDAGKVVQMGSELWAFGADASPPSCGAPAPDDPVSSGYQEGRVLMCLLARHPLTADTVGRKLMVRFLGDHAAQVETALLADFQASWLTTQADLPAVLKTLLISDAFKRSLYWEDNKIKRPLVFAASLVRTLGTGSEGVSAITEAPYSGALFNSSYRGLMGDFVPTGEGLYLAGPPTGYPEASASWSGAGVVVNHFNTIVRLINGAAEGQRIELGALKAELGLAASYSNTQLLVTEVAAGIGLALPAQSLDAIRTFVDGIEAPITDADEQVRRAIVGVLSTPEFLSH